MKAKLRQVRISPKKVNLVAGIVRNKPAQEALDKLKFTQKKAAKILYKVITSAIANAENNFKQSLDDLHITEIIVNEGPMYKRSIPCSRGRAHPLLKKTTHILVKVGIVSDKISNKKTIKKSSSSKKESDEKSEIKKPGKKSSEKKSKNSSK